MMPERAAEALHGFEAAPPGPGAPFFEERFREHRRQCPEQGMNVAVLAITIAEHIGLTSTEVRAFGISGLLHDLGKVSVPEDILNKPGKLTDAEREVMNRHPAEGARMILETEDQLDLAATVAYEHHIKLNGGGYPTLAYPRRCHQASDLVHVCDVFDALRTDRPYRAAWATAKVLSYLEEGGGTEFDPDLVRAFVQMMRSWEGKVLDIEKETTPIAAPEPAAVEPPLARASIAVAPQSASDEAVDLEAAGDDDADLQALTDLNALTDGASDEDEGEMSWE